MFIEDQVNRVQLNHFIIWTKLYTLYKFWFCLYTVFLYGAHLCLAFWNSELIKCCTTLGAALLKPSGTRQGVSMLCGLSSAFGRRGTTVLLLQSSMVMWKKQSELRSARWKGDILMFLIFRICFSICMMFILILSIQI